MEALQEEKRLERPRFAGLALLVVGVLHLVGRIGFSLPDWATPFAALSGLNLLLTGLAALTFQRGNPARTLGLLLLVTAFGFLAEYAGVQTGFPFGAYHYTQKLGWGWGGVPFVIAFVWGVLLYAVHQWLKRRAALPLWGRALLAASVLTIFDGLLEPFAVSHGLWVWKTGAAPLQNYLAWFGISFLLYLPLGLWEKSPPNKVAIGCFVIQVIFLGSFLF